MVMDKGSLIEIGTHNQLVEKKGLYHYLFSQQESGEVESEKSNTDGLDGGAS